MTGTWKRGWEHFWCRTRDGKFPLCSGHVLEDMISVSSREKVEDIYAVVSLICFEVGMLALTWFSRPTRVEDSDCVGSSAHQAVPPSSAGWC